jgi:hypothetical protein
MILIHLPRSDRGCVTDCVNSAPDGSKLPTSTGGFLASSTRTLSLHAFEGSPKCCLNDKSRNNNPTHSRSFSIPPLRIIFLHFFSFGLTAGGRPSYPGFIPGINPRQTNAAL